MSFTFKQLYLYLFNRITDAIEALENGEYSVVKQTLEDAQLQAEKYYIESNLSDM